ncbi:MAG: exodeoxyribonuclease V subunit alpha [Rudaea sp.]|uniref:exodeoxyribonuclease V subunit alpha n=1 Tax=unclassified Rudaea TaxID=2627037 RepID=UPI0010F8D133|nr:MULTISPECIES: exodeoxyribonuclease V subunit alpha [unclassified Rudaea]MBN8885357.1 exodeoxyribonuclease V subunit alpha [Rudaea sp.]
MTTPLIDRLEALGVLQAVDAALGRLLAVKSADAGEALGVAAALVSAALARGHSCLPLAALHDFAADLAIDAEAKLPPRLPTVETVRAALSASSLVARDVTAAAALVFDAEERIYLRRYYVYEQTVAEALRARLADSSLAGDIAHIDPPALRAALAQPAAARSRSDDLDQRIAVLLALRSRFLIISGGPGSGKTTTVLRLLSLIVETAPMRGAPPPRIALAAPTGKAAARLSETLRARAGDADSAIPTAAATVHRLLGLNPSSGRARFDRRNPLPYDLVVIDEASMLDLALAARLCEALAPPTRLILLGDRDQLAAVEAGRVFGALSHAAGDTAGYSPGLAQWLENSLLENVDVAAAPNALADAYVELRGNHRFTAQSAIGRLAVALRRGDVENALSVLYEGRNEALMLPVTAAELTQRTAAEIAPGYAELAGAADADAAFAVADRFRLLCALREGPFGARALNAEVERELRRRSGAGADEWYAGRLVIVGGNDYRLGLFNGDIGVALPSGTDGALEVWFRNADGSLRALPPLVLSACEPAYALTVHKAQGSEFDEVAVVLPERESRVLTRELVYTAVTRARKKVRLWASADILAKAMARSTQRWSGLAAALTR